MAKIRKLNIFPKFKGEEGRDIPEDSIWETPLMYSPKGKLFYIALPKDWIDYTPTDLEIAKLLSAISIKSTHNREPAFVGEIEKTVIEKAEVYFGAFLLEKPQITKVIIYKIKFKKGRTNSLNEYERQDRIGLDFLICDRQLYGSKATFTEAYTYDVLGEPRTGYTDVTHYVGGENARSVGQYSSGEYRWMPWTEEREQYFTNLRVGMHNLIDMMEQITNDNKSFQALIDRGGANLLGTGKEGGNIGEQQQ